MKITLRKKKGRVNSFLDQQKLREFIACRLALQKMLKSFRWEENDTRRKSGSMQRNEEHQKL